MSQDNGFRPILRFFLIFGSILLLSAILAPILFKFLPFKFERIFNRLVMIFSLIAVVRFVRIRKDHFSAIGLLWDKKSSLYYYMSAFGVGFGVLCALNLIKVLTGNAEWAMQTLTAMEWCTRILEALIGAFLIGLIEEFFFRGFIYHTLKRAFASNIAISVIITSVFYSLIHFVNADKPLIGPEPTFFDSLTLMTTPFLSLLSFDRFWPEALGLFLFGIVLNDLAIRSGSLYASMGLHAGCVLFVKLDGVFIFSRDQAPLLFSTGKAYDGLLGWFFLFVIGWILRWFIQHKQSQLR